MVKAEDRYEAYGKAGDLKELVNEISANVKLEYTKIVKMLPSWISRLTIRQQEILRLHYFSGLPINVIRYRLGLVSNLDVERSLDGGKKKLLKIAKEFEEA